MVWACRVITKNITPAAYKEVLLKLELNKISYCKPKIKNFFFLIFIVEFPIVYRLSQTHARAHARIHTDARTYGMLILVLNCCVFHMYLVFIY